MSNVRPSFDPNSVVMQVQHSARLFCTARHSSATLTSSLVAGRPSAGGRRTTAAGYQPSCLPRACGTRTRSLTASRPAPTQTFGVVAGRPSAGGRRTTAACRQPLRILRALVQSQQCVEHLERDAEFPLRFSHGRRECKVPTVCSVASHVAVRGFLLPRPVLFAHTRHHEIQSPVARIHWQSYGHHQRCFFLEIPA